MSSDGQFNPFLSSFKRLLPNRIVPNSLGRGDVQGEKRSSGLPSERFRIVITVVYNSKHRWPLLTTWVLLVRSHTGRLGIGTERSRTGEPEARTRDSSRATSPFLRRLLVACARMWDGGKKRILSTGPTATPFPVRP